MTKLILNGMSDDLGRYNEVKALRKQKIPHDKIAEVLGVKVSAIPYLSPRRIAQVKAGGKKYRASCPLIKKWSNFKARGVCTDGAKYREVLEKFKANPVCYLTGIEIDLMKSESYEIDHIIPLSRGGSSNIDNAGLASKKANKAKSNLTLEEFVQVCRQVLARHGSLAEVVHAAVS